MRKRVVRTRYEAPSNATFGWKTLDDEGVNTLRQSVAEDLLYVVERYRTDIQHHERSTYQMLLMAFERQCFVTGEKVTLKTKTGVERMAANTHIVEGLPYTARHCSFAANAIESQHHTSLRTKSEFAIPCDLPNTLVARVLNNSNEETFSHRYSS